MHKSITHIISGDLWAGSESQMLMQISEQQKHFDNVNVILFNKLETYKKYSEKGIKCRVYDEKLGFISIVKKCIEEFEASSESVIVTHGYKELFLGAILKYRFRNNLNTKLIATIHGLVEPDKNFLVKLKTKSYNFINQLILKFYADRVICVSHSIKKHFGFKHSRVVWNCVEFNSSSQKYTTQNNSLIMLGRLVPIKRFDLAIEAISKLKKKGININLIIAGSGPLEQELRKLIAKLKLEQEVELLGFRDDIDSLIKKSSAYLICSDLEGIPTALLEALILKKPCIATAVGGIPEIVKTLPENSCILVEPNNSDLLAQAIEDRLKNLEISDKTPEIIKEKFSKERAAQDFIEILSQL